MSRIKRNAVSMACLLALLAACGGSGSDPDVKAGGATPTLLAGSVVTTQEPLVSASRIAGGMAAQEATAGAIPVLLAPSEARSRELSGTVPTAPGVTLAGASRLLSQASMGATMYDIQQVAIKGMVPWLNEQFAMPQLMHRWYIDNAMRKAGVGGWGTQDQFYESFWQQVCTGQDQLRQRVAFGLSQIFVVSFVDDNLGSSGRMMGGYYDMLGKNAFGNFRTLLDDVAHHPAMAIYLSFLRNKMETETRVPDENFARELMQLMTIGLYELNQDGTEKLKNGKPIETYTHDDVAGLAKVFTGWSWAGHDKSNARFFGTIEDPWRDWLPLQNYPNFHSTSTKQVLGRPLTATTAEGELKEALDRLFNHPNVGPFIGRQLIQRMVTSNPSPAYVSRVAAAFNNNGSGVRGDMKAVIKAILLDDEARRPGANAGGRVREPVLRQANWMRAFYASSVSGKYTMWSMDDPVRGLGQSVLRAPSVFNFYRPGYAPPGTALESADMVAPELQIASEPAVVGYLNTMKNAIYNGMGRNYDIRTGYVKELAIVADEDKLVDRLNLLLMAGQMTPTTRAHIRNAVRSIQMPAAWNTDPADISYRRTNRVYLAVYLTMASPEYIIQQ
ncbi:DUF1800 family protein [Pseudoduganella plicata]|uniref:DUF1800 family protein n=2 Tax=Pseudoduganella plicata TaxID=321984 RepID=A0AA88C609_9BURK|nr:DUF1800 domain-containing protein [Pseudoduganella plicata]GGY85058.1 hypothetical protein GCM10007388_17860 [Pseudoduganella plicata]